MHKILLLSMLLFFAITGCVPPGQMPVRLDYFAFDKVRDNPAAFDEKVVNIKGYIQADVLGSTSLYATADDAAKDKMYDAIDLLPKDVKLQKAIKYKNPTCVIATGKFRTYKSGEFNFDMPSKIGVIELSSVSPC